MTNRKPLWILVLSIWALVLTACGGGGGGGSDVASGGTGGTGISAGSITGFGSIFVNGVEFSTNGATIRRDDVSINESELRKGMVVEVQGSIASSTSGTATTVTVEEAVRGPVESKTGTASAGTLIVLGQTVRVDDTTLIDNNVPDFAAITAGMLLEIHGHRTADGSIAATFIERKAAPIVFVVRGPVANHIASAQTFTIGALTVNYNGATVNDMPVPSGSNWNNLFVEVKGTSCSGNPVCGTLTATKVEPEGLPVNDADQAEVEGFVTAVNAPGSFVVGNVPVVTAGSTVFAGGTAAEIVVGVKLEVEGTLAGGVLTAEKVEFKDNIRLESDAATVDAGAGTLTLRGFPGVTINVNRFTEFKGGAGSLSDIAVGEHVRIRGRATGTNAVIATEVEQRSPDQRVILQGAVQGVVNPTVTILGVGVDTSTVPDQDFRDVNDNPIGATAFFNTVQVGDLVKARGALQPDGTTVLWDQIEFED